MRKLTNEEFIKRCQEFYPNIDFSKTIYTGPNNKVIIISPEYGEIEIVACQLMYNKWSGKPRSSTTKKFIQDAIKKFPDKNYDYSQVKYVNNYTKVTIICPIHGPFEIRPADFLRQTGCPMCKPKSLKENFIADWLKKNNVSYKSQYFIILDSGRRVFIDFVINNVFVEYNGIQHYQDVKFFKAGGHFQNKYFDFEDQQQRDKEVQEYCNSNNIRIVWLNYKQTDEEIIEKLKEIIKL